MTTESVDNERTGSQSAVTWRASRIQVLEDLAERESGLSARFSNVRFGLFVVFLAILAFSEATALGELGVWLAALPFVAFLTAVVFHQRVRERLAHANAGCSVHRDASHRANRDWQLVECPMLESPIDHPYARDLDVFGQASLAHLLSAVRTPAGRNKLQTWLLEPSDPGIIVQRQAAVADLSTRRLLREEVEIAGRLHVKPRTKSLADLRKWLAEPSWLDTRNKWVWYGRISTSMTLLLFAAHVSGVLPYALWLIPIILNFAVSRALMGAIHPIFERATSGEGAFVAYANVLRLFSAGDFKAPFLLDLQSHVRGNGWSAPDVIDDFRRIASLAEIRRSFVGAILQGVMMWDVFVLRRLERWRARWRHVAPSWFDVAAQVELLATFGGLADDNPDWCYPVLDEDGRGTLVAKKLGHPLLADNVRVANDVSIGPAGTFVFVTGSNMSGKSTLLRAVGCNVVLAHAGAPVCCEHMTLPAVQLYTNMRVSDSLATGESYYLAALKRLKLVIDAARRAAAPGPRVLYLLDEILQGTNSAERKIAVQGVMRELLDLHAIGAITSHDLSLIDEPILESVANAVHFTETVQGDAVDTVMTFDYRLRPGIAPTRNALRLMEIIGLRTHRTSS